jgi:spore maturation protein A
MAMGWIWTGMVALSVLCAAANGRMEAVTAAALEGAGAAVELCLGMLGGMCLWMGVMELMQRSGLAAGLARLFRPLLQRLLPRAARDEETLGALSANVSANLLGLGNAATPLGIRAAQRMARGCGGVADDELCRLVVLNTASIQLLPTTVASVRAACGSDAPLEILPAVWLTSVLSVTAGLLAARLLQRLWRDN